MPLFCIHFCIKIQSEPMGAGSRNWSMEILKSFLKMLLATYGILALMMLIPVPSKLQFYFLHPPVQQLNSNTESMELPLAKHFDGLIAQNRSKLLLLPTPTIENTLQPSDATSQNRSLMHLLRVNKAILLNKYSNCKCH